MASPPAAFFIGAGLVTLFVALCIFAMTYIQLRQRSWPLLSGQVVWVGVRGSLREQGDEDYLASSQSMNVLIRHEGKPFELSFSNAPKDIKVNDNVQLRVNSFFPRLFNSLEVTNTQSLSNQLFRVGFGVIAALILGYLGFILIQLGL